MRVFPVHIYLTCSSLLASSLDPSNIRLFSTVCFLIPLPVPNWASAKSQFIPNFSLHTNFSLAAPLKPKLWSGGKSKFFHRTGAHFSIRLRRVLLTERLNSNSFRPPNRHNHHHDHDHHYNHHHDNHGHDQVHTAAKSTGRNTITVRVLNGK